MTNRRKRAPTRTDKTPAGAFARCGDRTASPLMIPSTEAQNAFGRVLDRAAADQDIAITRHNVVRAVLVSPARYRQFVGRGATELDALASRFDELYESMQTASVREATARAVNTAPKAMGRAALAAARRERRRRKRG